MVMDSANDDIHPPSKELQDQDRRMHLKGADASVRRPRSFDGGGDAATTCTRTSSPHTQRSRADSALDDYSLSCKYSSSSQNAAEPAAGSPAPMGVKTTALMALAATSVAAVPYIASRSDADEVAGDIRETMLNPSDTLTILLVIGGDIIAKTLAQLAGPPVVPVAFSFGWVAYSFSVLVNVFGDGRLLPQPDYDAKVINVKSGISRDNRSWVLGRVLRDLEQPLDPSVALNISVFERTDGGSERRDWCFYSSVLVIAAQLGVAIIPCALHRDWSTLLVTGAGTILALVTGTLPQWKTEKYVGRPRGPGAREKLIALTAGNGSRYVAFIVDRTTDGAFDLEDLAGAQSPLLRHSSKDLVLGLPLAVRVTQLACVCLAALWIIFLLITTGLKSHPWYLLLVGGLGMLQNVVVAGARRESGTSRVHLTPLQPPISAGKAMKALMEAEERYEQLGLALLPEFFSTEHLRPDEIAFWDGKKRLYEERKMAKKAAEKEKEAEKEQTAEPRSEVKEVETGGAS